MAESVRLTAGIPREGLFSLMMTLLTLPSGSYEVDQHSEGPDVNHALDELCFTAEAAVQPFSSRLWA